MTTKTLTISDFLLARIEERDLFWGIVGEAKQAHPDRVRRHRDENTALRRIVEDEPARVAIDRHSHWERTLRILATVYADHPDYNPAWRP